MDHIQKPHCFAILHPKNIRNIILASKLIGLARLLVVFLGRGRIFHRRRFQGGTKRLELAESAESWSSIEKELWASTSLVGMNFTCVGTLGTVGCWRISY